MVRWRDFTNAFGDPAKDLYFALWAFLIYGFYGVVVETVYCYASHQRRGRIPVDCSTGR